MPSPIVPNIAQALQSGGAFGQQIANNLRQRRLDESNQATQAQAAKIKGQQRVIQNIAQESNAMLQFTDPLTLKANLVRRAQEVTANPAEGLNPADYIDMANRLGNENGFNEVTQELKADLARAQSIDSAIKQKLGGDQASTQFGAQATFKDSKDNLFFGTTKRNPNTGEVQSVLAAIDGSDTKPIGKIEQTGAFGQTAAQSTEKKLGEAGGIVTAKGEAEVKTPLGKIKLDESKAKNESEKQEIIDAKNTRRKEADGAIATINDLLTGDKFSSAFGRVVTATPEILRSQEAIDAKASLDQVIGLLSLESRQKLKGQGTISEGEANTLAQAATILANPLISDKAARKELKKVRNIFEAAAERNALNRGAVKSQAGQAEDTQTIGRFTVKVRN